MEEETRCKPNLYFKFNICTRYCNNFLTLGFGCAQAEILGFQGNNIFSCFQLGVFTHDGNGDKKNGVKEMRWCLWL